MTERLLESGRPFDSETGYCTESLSRHSTVTSKQDHDTLSGRSSTYKVSDGHTARRNAKEELSDSSERFRLPSITIPNEYLTVNKQIVYLVSALPLSMTALESQVLPLSVGGTAAEYKVCTRTDSVAACNRVGLIRPCLRVQVKVERGHSLVVKAYPVTTGQKLYSAETEVYETYQRGFPSNSTLLHCYGTGTSSWHIFLALEYANGGTLEDFFAYTPPPKTTSEFISVWTSFTTISTAVEAVHTLSAATASIPAIG